MLDQWISSSHALSLSSNWLPSPSSLLPGSHFRFKEKSYGSSGNTSGLSSSLAFTPVQGIELSNPHALQMAQMGSGTQSTYFSETGTFSKIKRL